MADSKYKVTKKKKQVLKIGSLNSEIIFAMNFKILKKIFQTILFKLKIGKEKVVVVEK